MTLADARAEAARLRADIKRGSEPIARITQREQKATRIAASADNAHVLFREGAMDTTIPDDAAVINVMVCQSPIPLRTSTNPTLMVSVPGRQSVFGTFFNNLRTWWLTLDRHCGVFIIAGGPPRLTNSTMPADAAQVINRQYLVQHGNSLTVRYMICDDPDLDDDLEWAGYRFERRTTHGARWRKAEAEA
ncbi:hypothetical protein ATE76_13025 [Sphingopyxis sp. H093]|nr:hypothetical protein ATE76_13025 [Sphingopyxis sp. H093]KTE25658.1 hypothetical protein ATE75_16270 [Sphingopyxis sp. H080]